MFSQGQPQAPPPPSQFQDASQLSSNLAAVLTSLQASIVSWQNNVLNVGNNFTSMAAGGAYVSRDSIEMSTSQVSAAQSWLQQYLTIKLINFAWWSQGVYIAFMPYGTVNNYTGPAPFTKDNCTNDYLNARNTIAAYVCDTADIFVDTPFPDGGMARLTWYSPSNANEDGLCNVNQTSDAVQPAMPLTNSPDGWASGGSFNLVDGAFHFSPYDVVNSSLRSWQAGGWNYDFINDVANQASGAPTGNAEKALAGVAGNLPSDAGMYNLPVVVITDGYYWPDNWPGWAGYDTVVNGQVDKNNKPLVDSSVLAPDMLKFCQADLTTSKAKQGDCYSAQHPPGHWR